MKKKKNKFKDAIEDMAKTIKEKFLDNRGRLQCGIIYCLSRNDCEKVADELSVSTKQAPHVGCVRQEEKKEGWVAEPFEGPSLCFKKGCCFASKHQTPIG